MSAATIRLDVSPHPSPPLAPARLSHRLRAETSAAHAAVELATGLPGSVRDRAGYAACLLGFARVVLPLESALARVDGLAACGLDAGERARGPALLADLSRLGLAPPAPAPTPAIDDLASALGALYVIEGSVLGGRVVLDDLAGRLGHDIHDASAFFGGRGPRTGALWQAFRAALDRFGEERPGEAALVVASAARTFDAFTRSFTTYPIQGTRA